MELQSKFGCSGRMRIFQSLPSEFLLGTAAATTATLKQGIHREPRVSGSNRLPSSQLSELILAVQRRADRTWIGSACHCLLAAVLPSRCAINDVGFIGARMTTGDGAEVVDLRPPQAGRRRLTTSVEQAKCQEPFSP